MLAILILSSTFLIGYALGYFVRARRSQKRRAHYLMYAPYRSRQHGGAVRKSRPQTTAFGRVRRAF